MKTIGLLGGMSWESSSEYYRILNEAVRERLGPTASAPCILWSFDFAPIERLQRAGDWSVLSDLLVAAAGKLETAGAELLLLCTNTMHRVAPALEAALTIPLIHIADVTGASVRACGIRKVGLLGTAFTMEQAFYKERLSDRHGLSVIVPDEQGRSDVHRIIYQELVAGMIRQQSRQVFAEIIRGLVGRGAEAIILGCTEIMLLVGPEDSPVPLFDTTSLHARAAVEIALQGG